MKSLIELRRDKRDAVVEARDILNTLEKQDRSMTREESLRYSNLKEKIASTEQAIVDAEERDAIEQRYTEERRLDQPVGGPIVGAADYGDDGDTREGCAAGPVFVRSGKQIADPELGQGPIDDNNEFYRAATSKQYDPRLQQYEQRASKLYDLPNAGLLVPESSTSNIFDRAIETAVFWPGVATYPIRNARSVVIPAFNDSDHSDGTLWGLSLIHI